MKKIAIIGLGYVGLPLASSSANTGPSSVSTSMRHGLTSCRMVAIEHANVRPVNWPLLRN
jgi:UDP-N-acetyl-D-mannosaminuronate dehydrogenase